VKGKRKGFKKQGKPRKLIGKKLKAPAKGKTAVEFPDNPSTKRSFDFSPWYGVGIDAITSACQGVISAKLDSCGESEGGSVGSIVNYCGYGLRWFLSFCATTGAASSTEMTLADIDRELMELYLSHLRTRPAKTATGLLSRTSQKNMYTNTKSVLDTLCTLNLLPPSKDLFPANPFPGSNGRPKGQKSLSDSELKPLIAALSVDLEAIQTGRFKGPMSQALSVVVLGISLRTGLNPTPLLEITRDALKDHPLFPDYKILVVYKRRGNSTYIQPLRWSDVIEDLAVARTDVVGLYNWVVEHAKPLVAEAPNKLKDRLWLYRSEESNRNKGNINVLSSGALFTGIAAFVDRHNLRADDGTPLKLNLSRMRKTFVRHLFLLCRDPLVVAKVAGHTPKVNAEHYHEITPEAERGHKFMGEIWLDTLRGIADDTARVSRISERKLKKAENTPVARCKDPKHGHRAPKNGRYCSSFVHCFSCKSFVVTGDDLYRVYSFYWLIIKERKLVPVKHWARLYRSVIRIVDDVIGPRFPEDLVQEVRERARTDPHPFWRDREMLIITAQENNL
jgi:hypothetical protein